MPWFLAVSITNILLTLRTIWNTCGLLYYHGCGSLCEAVMLSVEDVLHIVYCSCPMESIDCGPSLDYVHRLLAIVAHKMILNYYPSSHWLYTMENTYNSFHILLTLQFF